MASTTLFAPQVKAVQPAFIYTKKVQFGIKNGTIKIYFNLSQYNKIEDVGYIMLSLIDPNQVSGRGNNSKLNLDMFPTGFLVFKRNERDVEFDTDIQQYYFEIATPILIDTLTTNQYYHMQLYFIDSSVKELEKESTYKFFGITYQELEEYKDNISAASQVTFIRPIDNPTLYIDGEEKENITTAFLDKINGRLSYTPNSSIELLKNYSITIKQNNFVVFSSGLIENTLGLSFSTKLKYCYLKPGDYTLSINYNTLNDYNGIKEISLHISGEAALKNVKNFIIRNDTNAGAAYLSFIFPIVAGLKGNMLIQRASNFDDFTKWQTLNSVTIDYTEDSDTFIDYDWADFSVESGVLYKYRVAFEDFMTKEIQVSESIENCCFFEDIFLLDAETQLAVRFNPQISGYKIVTQESISNTLGSKYPIIRRNGDTKYRQFNISGTLCFQYDIDNFFERHKLDSLGKDLSEYFEDNSQSLFVKQDKALQFAKEFYFNYEHRNFILEKRFRDAAIDFLTNGKPKMFRSATEGNIIIYLSNISFTPNKQLGRQFYDFSATVTEVCEVSFENIIKYNILATTNSIQVINTVILEVLNSSISNNIPYVSAESSFKDGLLMLQGATAYDEI